MCPQKPDAIAIASLKAKIGRKVEVEEFFLTPTKLAQIVDRSLMTPLPNHNPNAPRQKVYSADEVRGAQAEAVALDRSVHPRITHRAGRRPPTSFSSTPIPKVATTIRCCMRSAKTIT